MPIRLWSVDVRNASNPRAGAAASSATGGRQPLIVLVALDDAHAEAHVPVAQHAELGAASDERAGPGRRDVELVVDPGDHVALLEEVGDPEGVGDVVGD